MVDTDQSLIPPPGPETANWPAITRPIVNAWELSAYHLDEAMNKYADQLATIGKWLLSVFSTLGFGLLELIAATIIGSIMLHYTNELSKTSKLLFAKLAGKQGAHFYDISIVTIRNVVKGIIGVAAIQTLIIGIGLFVGGVPYAGLWTIICLVLSIAQVGPFIIVIPSIIYMYSNTDTLHATLYTVWMAIALASDNFLKPILLGRGAPVPMMIVFMGAIGGFIFQGFLGLFLGAVILSLGYILFLDWINEVHE
jgi:predicted PurR-regulated permease PerM